MRAGAAVLTARVAVGTWLVLLGGRVIDGRRGPDMVATAVSNQIDSEQWAASMAAAYGLDEPP